MHTCSRTAPRPHSPLYPRLEYEHDPVLFRRPIIGRGLLSRVAGIAPAPLLPGEQETEYANLIARIIAVAQPRDAIEDLLTRDVIDLSWEILRLRRIKAGILKASMSDGVREVLDGLGCGRTLGDYTKRLGQSWAAGDKESRKEVMAALRAAGLTIDEVTAKTFESKLDSFERLDRCWRAPRHDGITPSAKLTATASRLAARCDKRSMKFRMQNSETSRLVKKAEQLRLDQQPPTASQSRQREIEHRAPDSSRKGSHRAKCVSSWLECSSSLGPFARTTGRGDGA